MRLARVEKGLRGSHARRESRGRKEGPVRPDRSVGRRRRRRDISRSTGLPWPKSRLVSGSAPLCRPLTSSDTAFSCFHSRLADP